MRTVLAMVAVFVLAVGSAWGQARMVAPNSPGVLAGIRAVYLSVASVDPGLEAADVTQESLREVVVERLREAGVRVLTKKERTVRTPALFVTLSTTAGPTAGSVLYTLRLSLREDVVLERDRRVTVILAETWETASFGLVGGRSIETIHVEAEDLADEFTRDVRLGNPGMKPGRGSALGA